MHTRFDRLDAQVRAIGGQLLTIGEALRHRPEDVSVLGPNEEAVPPDVGADGWLGIEEPLPTKEQIRELLLEWHAARKEVGAS
jgi:hypothetical protein